MFDPSATYEVLDPIEGGVFGKLQGGFYTDLKFRGTDSTAIDGTLDGLNLTDNGKVIGTIEGDELVQEGSGVRYPLRRIEG